VGAECHLTAQAHHLSQYGVMPPESDSARDWQAWYREATDKAQILSDQVAMLALPMVDAKHRWDHGSPGDWCGTGGCRTLAHEQAGERYVAPTPPAPDTLERSITSQMNQAVLSREDKEGRMPAEVTVSSASVPRLDGRHGEHLATLQLRHRQYTNEPRQKAYHASRDTRDEHHKNERRERANQERRDYDREYESDQERESGQEQEGSRRDGGYERRERQFEASKPAQENAPVKRLYGKVNELQDEVRHLVKILSRRQMTHRDGQQGNESERHHQGRRKDERQDGTSETFKEHDGMVRMGNTGAERGSYRSVEERKHSDSQSKEARLSARHVVDWLRGAILAARV